MALSPEEAQFLTPKEQQECASLELEIDAKARSVAPKSSSQRVIFSFSQPIRAALQEELRQRYDAVGWNVAISGSLIILRPKEDQLDSK